MTPFTDAEGRLKRIRSYSFHSSDLMPPEDAFQPYNNAHNEGPLCAPSLGGIGAGNIGRDLAGRFSRWHLQNGVHRHQPFDCASLCLRWQQGAKSEAYRLGAGDWDRPLPHGTRTVDVLFPLTIEHVSQDGWPVELIVESYSPIIPQDNLASCLPVAVFDVSVRNTSTKPAEFDMAFFWPNVLGWRPATYTVGSQAPVTLYDQAHQARRKVAWVDKTNAGNRVNAIDCSGDSDWLEAVAFTNEPNRPPRRDMEGTWFLGVAGADNDLRHSHHSCFRCARGKMNPKSVWLLPAAEHRFFETGQLSNSDMTWHAKCMEVLGGAVAAGATLQPGEETTFAFVLSWDMPLTQAGSGRTWAKAYTQDFGCSGDNAQAIAELALQRREAWRVQILAWQDGLISNAKDWVRDDSVAGAMINELYFLVDGGPFWLAGQADSAGLPEPRLGAGPHFSILEGYDSGYYFLSTFDLWPYAMLPVVTCWPELSRLLYEDFLRSIPIDVDEKRIFYKLGTEGTLLARDKIPHDVGSPPGDPWHELNDYQYANDSNQWKDHNPMFLLSYYLHTAIADEPPPSPEAWATLKLAAAHMESQDKDGDGLPEHDTHGDNTWDAVEVNGPAIYSAALTIGALAAMKTWAEQVGDADAKGHFESRLEMATQAFEAALWNGTYYNNATVGERRNWVACDGLFGILLAKVAGLGDLLPVERVQAHLKAVYKHNFKGLDNGRWGPSLQAPPAGWDNAEGGVQVDEILVGAAWSCIGLMLRYGLADEANEIAATIVRVHYEESGLQFRTPAAWRKERGYRAPLNLRPMAIGFLLDERR
ncbi:MAG: hypothetical protein HON70_15455 [Lentisphaerae bacterium]|nr:hypothetical protein [Lentisphaerota bacterium]